MKQKSSSSKCFTSNQHFKATSVLSFILLDFYVFTLLNYNWISNWTRHNDNPPIIQCLHCWGQGVKHKSLTVKTECNCMKKRQYTRISFTQHLQAVAYQELLQRIHKHGQKNKV